MFRTLKQNSVQEKLFRAEKPESNQEKIAAMRAALQASKAAAENKTADLSKSTEKVIEIDDDDEDAETLEDIANFISNSDPVNKDEEKDEMYTLQDEFTDNSLKFSQNNKLNDLYNLPKGNLILKCSVHDCKLINEALRIISILLMLVFRLFDKQIAFESCFDF